MHRLATRLSAALFAVFAASAHAGDGPLFQYSTINALLSGLYDGQLTMAELKGHGDLGLGTFNRLDGEMVVIDGNVWQARSDGALVAVPDEAKTPFAVVTRFDADHEAEVAAGLSLEALEREIDTLLATRNGFFAFRIDGEFRTMTVRSVPAQQPPYPPLAEAAKQQAVFELGETRGSLVGFYTPPYVGGLNVPGYHFHFIDAERQHGGHVLALTTGRAKLRLDAITALLLQTPTDAAFAAADLAGARREELNRVEKR